MSSQPEVNVRVIRQIQNPQLKAGGPTSHWIGPETLVELTMEGRNFNALADSGSQVNTITPALVQQYGFPILPLEDLPVQPHRVRWEMYQSTQVCHLACASVGYHRIQQRHGVPGGAQ